MKPLILLVLLLSSCIRPNPNGGLYIPIPSKEVKYPIDVFYKDDKPPKSYDILERVSIKEESPEFRGTTNGRMLNRGNDEDQKRLLMAQLVLKAQNIGADALVNVNYRVMLGEKTTGYELWGIAVRYK